MSEEIRWDDKAQAIFNNIINNLPQFHRNIAQKLVKESAEEIAVARGADAVKERDLVEAFFKEVPPAFKGMMRRRMTNLGIDCARYADG